MMNHVPRKIFGPEREAEENPVVRGFLQERDH
jgi:hypothetical protein